MLAQPTTPAAHADCAPAAAPVEYWSINHPEYDGTSLAELITSDNYKNDWLQPGDVVYIAEIRRHVLTDADLKAALGVVAAGAA